MNKKIIITLTAIFVLVASAFGLFWFKIHNQSKKQDVPTNLTAKKTNVVENETTESSSSSSESVQQVEQPSEPMVTADYKIIEHLDDIEKEVQKLHDFSNGTTDYWNSVRSSLKDNYGITVSDNTKGGFGLYDVSAGEQDSLISGIVVSVEYEKQSNNEVKFRVVTRTGRAGIVDNDIDYTAKEVRKAIKKSGQDVTVDYQLTINEDGTTGELVWLAGNWW